MAKTGNKGKLKIKNYINYIILGAVLLALVLLDTVGILKRADMQMFAQIGYSIILAVSLNIVVGFLGELSLGHAGFMCIGAYIGGLLANYLHTVIASPLLVILLAMPVGALAAALLGFIIGLPILRLKGDYLAIVTLAFGEIVRTVCRNQDIFGGPSGLVTTKYGQSLYIVALVMALFTVMVAQNLMRSKHGRAIQAIRDNEIAARAMGVNVTYYKMVGFVIAAAFAGVAGVIYSQQTSPVLNTAFDYNYSIEILVMVVLGGMGNITGSIISAALLTFVNFKLTTTLSGDAAMLRSLFYALILIFMIMWNNAPFLAPARQRLGRFFTDLRGRIFGRSDDDKEGPVNAAWDTVPTKIPMDALLSTDIVPDHSFEPDAPGKNKEG